MTTRIIIAVVVGLVVVIGIGYGIAVVWRSAGGAGLPIEGWVAMGFGFLFTLILGVGLMALMFISNRRGYDDLGPPEH